MAGPPKTKDARFSKRGRPRLADNKHQEQYEKARAKREEYKAKREKLEYERLKGTLVNGEQVNREAFNQGRQIRDAMLNIPDRIASMIAAEPDQDVVHEILTKEIREALTALTQ